MVVGVKGQGRENHHHGVGSEVALCTPHPGGDEQAFARGVQADAGALRAPVEVDRDCSMHADEEFLQALMRMAAAGGPSGYRTDDEEAARHEWEPVTVLQNGEQATAVLVGTQGDEAAACCRAHAHADPRPTHGRIMPDSGGATQSGSDMAAWIDRPAAPVESLMSATARSWAPPPLNPYAPMVINVALTGAVPSRADNPTVPFTPEEIAADVLACADAGASVFHLHMRDETGAPVHRLDLYERTVRAIRSSRADLVLCVTTSSRVGSDLADRMTGLELTDDLLPEFASLSLGSFNFPRTVSVNPPDQIRALLHRMNERGIRPEFEVFELGMVNTLWQLIDEGLVVDPPVVNILLGSLGSAPAFVADLGRIVERLPPGSVWAAAGIGVFQRPMTIAAAVMGGNVRTGLEDSPRGSSAADSSADPGASASAPWTNVRAVELAVRAADLAGRPVASAAQARELFGLPSRPPQALREEMTSSR